MFIDGLKSQGKSYLRWLKWASGASTPNSVHHSLDPILLDPIRKIEAQGAGVTEGVGPELIPCCELNGEPLIRVRLPIENRNFSFSP